jgi:hypothetical protein
VKRRRRTLLLRLNPVLRDVRHWTLAGHDVILLGFVSISILFLSNRSHYLTLDIGPESPSFFQKYKEEFGKQAVTAAISGLIGGVIGYLFGHFLR